MSTAAAIAFIAAGYDGSVTAILGAPRTGKSRIVKDAQHQLAPLAVFDPYARRDRARAEAGAPVSPWAGVWVTPRELVTQTREVMRVAGQRAVIIAPTTLDETRLAREFTACSKVLFAYGRRRLLCEEIGLYGRQATEAVNTWASGSGHADASLIVSCQSLGRVQKDARRNITRIVAFAQAESEDLAELRKRCGDTFVRAVARLDGPPNPSPPLTWAAGQGLKEAFA